MSQPQPNRPANLSLTPLPYHEALRTYLKTEEAAVWQWYTAHKVRAEQAEAVRFDLLKSSYRVERENQPSLYAAADAVVERLGLAVPVTLYQAQKPAGLNASMARVPDEAHLVLHGPVASRLTEAEFRVMLGHELSHLFFWRAAGGEFLISEEVISAMTLDPSSEPPHFATARLLRLYTEIFCDRGALCVADDPLSVVSMLLKVDTGVDKVDPKSYLRQAEEVLSRPGVRTAELTHPEAFIRAWAIKLWSDGDPETDAKIRQLIEGTPALNELDLLGQRKVAGLTRRLLDALIWPKWFQSEAVLAHARLFFEDYAPPGEPVDDPSLPPDLRTDDPAMQDYYCFVLLDFVAADRDLEEAPVAAALVLSEKLGLKERFAEIVQRELRLRKRQFEKIDQEKESLLAEAGKEAARA